jgi:hypothetical protein
MRRVRVYPTEIKGKHYWIKKENVIILLCGQIYLDLKMAP